MNYAALSIVAMLLVVIVFIYCNALLRRDNARLTQWWLYEKESRGAFEALARARAKSIERLADTVQEAEQERDDALAGQTALREQCDKMQTTLRRLDGFMANTGRDDEHPWRVMIAASLPEKVQLLTKIGDDVQFTGWRNDDAVEAVSDNVMQPASDALTDWLGGKPERVGVYQVRDPEWLEVGSMPMFSYWDGAHWLGTTRDTEDAVTFGHEHGPTVNQTMQYRGYMQQQFLPGQLVADEPDNFPNGDGTYGAEGVPLSASMFASRQDFQDAMDAAQDGQPAVNVQRIAEETGLTD